MPLSGLVSYYLGYIFPTTITVEKSEVSNCIFYNLVNTLIQQRHITFIESDGKNI